MRATLPRSVVPAHGGASRITPGTAAWRSVVYALLVLSCITALVPMVWLVAATTKRPEDMFSYTFFARHATTQNFIDLFSKVPFVRYALNSIFLSCATVCIQLFFASLAGYALAKYEFAGKKAIMGLMLATMLLPGAVTMAPGYELLYRLGMVNTYPALLVTGVGVFGIFLFRQSIIAVPDELVQAARIDGCSEFGIYQQIVMPITRPMIGAFCLMTFMGTWNSFLWPQILLQSGDKWPLPVALNQMIGLYQQEYGMLMAGTLLSVLPPILLFFILQKEFVAGLTAGAVKG